MVKGFAINEETDWDKGDLIPRLCALWGEGHSTAEIGRRLGVTKNAVVAKARRLDLPARPSPILRREDGTCYQNPATLNTKKVVGPTLPPLASVQEGRGETPSKQPVVSASPKPVAHKAKPVPAAPISASAAQRPYGRVVLCLWPVGEPGTRDFRFCDAPSKPDRPYCEDHAKVAYVKVRDRREDAA